MSPMRTIAMINQKGGVGKTTTVANLSAALAARGRRVLAIDMDPQSHLTMHLGADGSTAAAGMYEVLTAGTALTAASLKVNKNLSLVPSSIDLAGAEIELVSTVGREQLLSDRLAGEDLPFDYALIDCPPSLGLLTLNALAAADEVIIPLQPHFLALQGFGKLLETVALVQRRINRRLRVSGVVLCMYESATRLAAEVTDEIEKFLREEPGHVTPWAGARLFATRIRRNVKLAECPSFGKTIATYAPQSNGAVDYEALADEFLTLHGDGAAAATAAPTQSGQAADAPAAASQSSQDVTAAPQAAAAVDGEVRA
jgi:chromosome partitioning protein